MTAAATCRWCDDEDEAEKIASDVRYFKVTDKDHIFYEKQGLFSLYQYDIKKKDNEKIASHVSEWYINEAEDKIVWITFDGILYTKELKKGSDNEKLDSDVTDLFITGDDLNTIFYQKEDTIYTLKNLKDREKVTSEAFIISDYKDNGVYYRKLSKETVERTAVL